MEWYFLEDPFQKQYLTNKCIYTKHNNKGVYVKKLFVKLRIPKVKAYPTKDLFFTMLCFDSTLHHTTLKCEIPLQTRATSGPLQIRSQRIIPV